MDLALSTRSVGEVLIVSVAGEIDVYTAPKLREQLIAAVVAGNYKIIVDLTEVSFLDSTGLGVFMGALKRVKAHDGTLELVISRDIVLKIFQITGLTKVFAIHSTLEEALPVATN